MNKIHVPQIPKQLSLLHELIYELRQTLSTGFSRSTGNHQTNYNVAERFPNSDESNERTKRHNLLQNPIFAEVLRYFGYHTSFETKQTTPTTTQTGRENLYRITAFTNEVYSLLNTNVIFPTDMRISNPSDFLSSIAPDILVQQVKQQLHKYVERIKTHTQNPRNADFFYIHSLRVQLLDDLNRLYQNNQTDWIQGVERSSENEDIDIEASIRNTLHSIYGVMYFWTEVVSIVGYEKFNPFLIDSYNKYPPRSEIAFEALNLSLNHNDFYSIDTIMKLLFERRV